MSSTLGLDGCTSQTVYYKCIQFTLYQRYCNKATNSNKILKIQSCSWIGLLSSAQWPQRPVAHPRMGQVKSIFALRRVSLRGHGAQGRHRGQWWHPYRGCVPPGDNKEEGDQALGVPSVGGGPFPHPGEDRGVVVPMQGTGDAKFQWW